MEPRDAVIFPILNMTSFFSKMKTWLPGSSHYATGGLRHFALIECSDVQTWKHLLKSRNTMHTFYSGGTNKWKDPVLKTMVWERSSVLIDSQEGEPCSLAKHLGVLSERFVLLLFF